MKKWEVTDVRWANTGDLNLPFWKIWNENNPLPNGFWQRIWEYPYVCSRIPKSGSSLDVGGTYPFVLFPNFPEAISLDCRDLNTLDHPLHKNKWPKDKLLICDAMDIPVEDNFFDYAFSISAIEEMPDLFAVLKEMLRFARHRIVVTMDISNELGVQREKLRGLENFLGCRMPEIPADSLNSTSNILKDFGQKQKTEYAHIRVLGITIDSRDVPRSVAVLIPHWESFQFLKPCLKYIQRHRIPGLIEKIYVLDDASRDGSFEKAQDMFKSDKSIEFLRFERPNKSYNADVGLLLDYGLLNVKEQYVAMIDADLFPLTDDWLAFPIWLIERYNSSSVGLDTGLSTAYLPQTAPKVWWQPANGYIPSGGIYDNEWFSCINNLYRIMPTALAKVVSESVGFTRATPEPSIRKRIIDYAIHGIDKIIVKKIPSRIRPNFKFICSKYRNKRYPYLPGGCDNGVAANHFIDINRMGSKFNIPLTSYIGLTPTDGAFGQNISGLAFHFALSTRALSKTRREVNNAGKEFIYWVKRIQENQNLDETLFQEIISASGHFRPGGYNGEIPVSWYEEQYVYIQNLIRDYKKQNSLAI